MLMFYYRPTVEYAFTDIIDLGEQAPLGIIANYIMGRSCYGSYSVAAYVMSLYDRLV